MSLYLDPPFEAFKMGSGTNGKSTSFPLKLWSL